MWSENIREIEERRKALDAREQELNYVGRFDVKMIGLPRTIYDPMKRKEWKIRSSSYHHKFNDVDSILNTVKMDYEESNEEIAIEAAVKIRSCGEEV